MTWPRSWTRSTPGPAADEGATQTAVLVLVPTADPVVGPYRDRLDPTTRAGIPAHVTVLYPFVPPRQVTGATVRALEEAVGDVEAFSCRFDAVRWFDDDLLWLAPNPADPFAALTDRVATAFPDHPPYGGEHQPCPHLTVGYRRHASLDALTEAADELRPRLAIDAHVDRVHLLAGSHEPDSWRVLADLPLRRR